MTSRGWGIPYSNITHSVTLKNHTTTDFKSQCIFHLQKYDHVNVSLSVITWLLEITLGSTCTFPESCWSQVPSRPFSACFFYHEVFDWSVPCSLHNIVSIFLWSVPCIFHVFSSVTADALLVLSTIFSPVPVDFVALCVKTSFDNLSILCTPLFLPG